MSDTDEMLLRGDVTLDNLPEFLDKIPTTDDRGRSVPAWVIRGAKIFLLHNLHVETLEEMRRLYDILAPGKDLRSPHFPVWEGLLNDFRQAMIQDSVIEYRRGAFTLGEVLERRGAV